jgi:hypothetical protein
MKIYLYEMKVENMKDFRHVLRTIKFWKIDSPYPYEIWKFILENKNKVHKYLKEKEDDEYDEYFPMLTAGTKTEMLTHSIEYNEIDLAKYLIEKFKFDRGDLTILLKAVNFGTLEMVVFLHENRFTWNEKNICATAARNEVHGIEILEYLRDQGCHLDEYTCDSAATNKNQGLAILKWLRSQNPPCPWDEMTCMHAADNEHDGLKILKWLRSQNPPCPWNEDLCSYAARNETNGLEILKWLRSQTPPCPWNEYASRYAVRNEVDGLEIIKWLRAQDPPCPWDKYICLEAEENDSFGEEIVEWIREQDDCPCFSDEEEEED